ncbi:MULTISPECIES: valine--tRNA ligase [unclassified Sphingomonas]|jgi:valyl-tRNA synthetase|uniref:valine--tRNA ligase n=1 Tax=unclassified Sphingomonas TaxID=196159 RepID=UPI00083183EB|nr:MULTISPECIES: valine--tRNA ligase [unclassified Sphingomonas]
MTELAKTFDPAQIERRWYAHWESNGLFRPERPGAEPWTIVNPPPNVTGSLHIGHALDNTLQDILVRYERLRGKDALWVVGTDHAGIATQMVVERQLNERQDKRTNYTREQFVEKVWQWKAESGGQITGQLRRLGCSMDWANERFTMDPGFSKAVLKVFVDLYRDGLIYRDKRLVNWDPALKTAISDLEVEAREVQGHMWHFKYPLAGGETYRHVERDADGNVTLEEERNYISIATTRPETMLGDGAVAVHPDDERYRPIVGKLCEIPVGPREHRRAIPIITDSYPDPAFGSGAVKITGAHDENDYGVAQRNGIPMYRLMDEVAAMRVDGVAYAFASARAREIAKGAPASAAEIDALNLVPEAYRGLDRYEARKRVVADIDAEGLMIKVEAKTIMQPTGDRSGVVIEPMLTDQWYVDAKTLAQGPIEAVRDGRIKIVPKTWEKTFFNWMENIQPWCVSRQLWWGHRIPAWFAEDGRVFVAETEAEAQAEAGEDVALTRDEDVLDTWFSSALWPFATLGWPGDAPSPLEGRGSGRGDAAASDADAPLPTLSPAGRGLGTLNGRYPNDVLISGFDILFFWDARMMMQGMHFMGDVPFRTLYLHGLVRAADGQKMSKSKGNTVDPLGLIDQYGADALRFFMAAMESQGRDIKMDVARVEGYRNFATKLWNATRFAQANGIGASTSIAPPPASLAVNRWIIGETVATVRALDQALADLRFDGAANAIYQFVWSRFCDWYLELIKPVLSPAPGERGEGTEADETRAVAGWVLDQILVMLHPFMPFITEELWHALGARDGELIVAHWPQVDGVEVDAEAGREIDWLIRLVSEIRAARTELNVPPSARLSMIVRDADRATQARLDNQAAALARLARVDLAGETGAAGGAAQIVVDEATYVLPLEGIIDLDAERARLSKAILAAQKERDALSGRLDNPSFVARAKPEAVEKARADHAEKAAEAERLTAALARLG